MVIAVPVCFLHYSIVWVVVDVVADNAARLLVSFAYGAGCAARGGCGGVVGGNTAI
jgi:hypothetical protein